MTKNYKKRRPLSEKVEALDFGNKKQLIEEILSIFLAGCALFLLLSLLSYKGLNSEGLPDLSGWTGVAGGYLSFAIFQLMGYASYGAALIVGMCALLLFLQKTNLLKPLRLAFSFLALILTASGLHVLLLENKILGGHLAGGAIGQWVADLLLPFCAKAGTLLILGTSILILLVLVSGMSIRSSVKLLGSCVKFVAASSFSVFKRAASYIASLRKERVDSASLEEAVRPEDDICEPDESLDEDIEKIVISAELGKKKKESAGKKSPRREKLSNFKLPPYDLLKTPQKAQQNLTKDQMKSVDQKLIDTLGSYGIKGEVTAIHPGPVVTTFEFRPEKGTKISSITSREDDITMSLEAQKVRIVAPIPGKNAVGFEIPNPSRTTVLLRELIQDPGFDRARKKIPLALGKDIIGRSFIADLDKMPHLLIAGTTGSGKSVNINAMLMSLLYMFTPDELRLILIDPKQVEMQTYGDVPHLMLPVVTDPKKAAVALKWAVDEMEKRYQYFSTNGSKDIRSYNKKVKEEGDKSGKEQGAQDTMQQGDSSPSSEAGSGNEGSFSQPGEPLPYIIIVIDELADLMLAAVRDVEWAVTRLAQKARAAGIHLIVATQRPSVNVVTGLIKANFPCRIAFRVAAKVDSRVMLDTNGAETLLGDGDMLILPPGTSELVRIQGAFVSEEEIRNVAQFLKAQRIATYKEEILAGELEDSTPLQESEDADEYYQSAVNLVTSERKASVSYLQRRFAIGYNRAARIMEKMEREGVVGPSIPGKPYREVLLQSPP